MQKHNIIAVGAVLLTLMASGCSSQNGDSELDELIGSLPAAQISDGKVVFNPSSENDNTDEDFSYLSISGKVISVSTKSITIETDKKEYKFTVTADTKTFGGKIDASEAVTVTYEGDGYSEGAAAVIITVLSGDSDDTVSDIATTAETVSDNTSAPEETVVTTDVTEVTAAENNTEETAVVTEITSAADTAEVTTAVVTEAASTAAETSAALETTTADN